MGLFDLFRRSPAASEATPALAQPNPQDDLAARQALARINAARRDSLQNVITGLGVIGADRRMGARYDQRQPLVMTEQYWLYKQTWLASVICECVPQHCARAWFDVTVKENPEASEALQRALDKYRENFRWADTLANMTGGALLVMGVDDGETPDKPVNLKRTKSLIWLKHFDRWYAFPSSRVEDPRNPNFGEPAAYSVFGQAAAYIQDPKATAVGNFDRTRCLRFDGNKLPELLKQANQGWNDSVLERVYDALRDANQGTDAGAKTLTDFTLTILKIVGMSQDVLATGDDALNTRLATLSQTMNTAGVMAVDDSETVERIGHKLAGFRDVLDLLLEQVAGASGVPRAILYGQAMGTSRAGADTDMRAFYDRVQDKMVSDWEPKLRHLCEIILATDQFKSLGIKIDDVDISPRSLWQEEPEVTAKIAKDRADTLTALNGTGSLTVEQVHRAGVEILQDAGLQVDVDDGFVSSTVPLPEEPDDTAEPAPNPGSQYVGAMPPLAGKNSFGLPIIPDVNSNAAGGA